MSPATRAFFEVFHETHSRIQLRPPRRGLHGLAEDPGQADGVAQHCGRREHLNDDLHVVTLSEELIATPPIALWPQVVRSDAVPPDVEALLLTGLEKERVGGDD